MYGRLPVLGQNSPRENVFGRIQSGNFHLASTLPAAEFNRFVKTVKRPSSDKEAVWFQLNPATWPVIKIDGARKFEAAKSLNAIVEEVAAAVGPRRKFSAEHLATLRGYEDQLRSDMLWQVQVGGGVNMLASTVNAFAGAAVGVLDALGPRQGLFFAALYNSVDEVFRKGAPFDPAAWRPAMEKALLEAAIDDVAASPKGNVLRSLLTEFARFAEKLIQMDENEARRRELRRDLEGQIDRIRIEIERYQRSFDKPLLMEAVAKELTRQPRFIIAVVNDYLRTTGKRPARTLPEGPPDGIVLSAVVGLLPFTALLMVRSREDAVKSIESDPHSREKLRTMQLESMPEIPQ